jgi:hypothetical protein
MIEAIFTIPQYAFMARCSVKKKKHWKNITLLSTFTVSLKPKPRTSHSFTIFCGSVYGVQTGCNKDSLGINMYIPRGYQQQTPFSA